MTRVTNDPAEDIAPVFPDPNWSVTPDQLLMLAASSKELTEITDGKTYEAVRKAIERLRKTRLKIDQERQDLNRGALTYQRLVNQNGKDLLAIIGPEEDRLTTLRKTVDAQKEAERVQREMAERDRIAKIQTLINDDIRGLVQMHVKSASHEVELAIAGLREMTITAERFGEFAIQAEAARQETLIELEEMRAGALHDEMVEAREKREAEERRIELERQQAEVEADMKRLAEDVEREQKKIAAERAELDAEREKLRQEREAHEAAARAEAEEKEAARRVQEAQEAAEREAAETARLAEEKAAREAQEAEEAAARAMTDGDRKALLLFAELVENQFPALDMPESPDGREVFIEVAARAKAVVAYARERAQP